MVGEEEQQEVVLTFELVAWMVNLGFAGCTFSGFMTFMIFTTFYDEELNK